jgi:pyruvate kinase
MLARRTTIVATLGPATNPPCFLDEFAAAGPRLRAAELAARLRTLVSGDRVVGAIGVSGGTTDHQDQAVAEDGVAAF